MDKSPDAFRTISEVADWLGTPTHVLRFWESRFTQIKPVKRAGGRRYYRPNDMALLGGIKKLLHDDGLTIRGVQKILREQGVKHVAAMSQPIDGEEDEAGAEQSMAPATHVAEAPAVPPSAPQAEPGPGPEPVAAEEPGPAPGPGVEAEPEPAWDRPAPVAEEPAPAFGQAVSEDPSAPAEPEPPVREVAPEAEESTEEPPSAHAPEPPAPEAEPEPEPEPERQPEPAQNFNPFAGSDAGPAIPEPMPPDPAAPEAEAGEPVLDVPRSFHTSERPAPPEPVDEPGETMPEDAAASPEPTFTASTAPQGPEDPAPAFPADAAVPDTVPAPAFTRAAPDQVSGGTADAEPPAPPTEPMAVQPYDVPHGEPGPAPHADPQPHESAEPPAASPAHAAAVPEGPTVAEQVLRRLRKGTAADPATLRPVYERLVDLRGRMSAGPPS